MERGSKRKAVVTASPAVDNRAVKRQKTPQVPATPSSKARDNAGSTAQETPKSTTDIGVRFIAQMKAARDKTGRLISTAFLTLPDKKQMPGYYQVTVLPIAIETIEGKIERFEYPNLTTIESDVKRMVNNAKAYNEVGSEIYMDAERIRKMTSNFMVKANPAYKDPGYVAFATPLPSEVGKSIVLKTKPPPVVEEESVAHDNQAAAKIPSVRRSMSAAVVKDASEEAMEDDSYAGKTFQQAQELLISQVISYQDGDGFDIFTPFVNLPPRSLTDYYSFIKNPISLKGVQKKIRGVHGRTEITGVSDFKSWDALETEIKRVSGNAKDYNEDGSDIYVLAGELEQALAERLADAKQHVEEPTQPTLKLKMAPQPAPIKLKLGQHKASPAPREDQRVKASPAQINAHAGVSVDQAALQRQKDLVAAGTNGHSSMTRLTPAQPSVAKASPEVKAKPAIARTPSQTMPSSTPQPNGVNADQPRPHLQTASSVNGTTTTITTQVHRSAAQHSVPAASMLPPSTSASGMPNHNPTASQNSVPVQPYVPNHAPPAGFESKWRKDGKDSSEALISNVYIFTHADLHLSRPLKINVPPLPALSKHSITLNLPATHYYLQLEPTLSTALISGTRPYKLFVTINGTRVQPNILAQAAAEGGKLQFDVKLMTGMNRIDVECGTPSAKPTVESSQHAGTPDLDIERMTAFVQLMR